MLIYGQFFLSLRVYYIGLDGRMVGEMGNLLWCGWRWNRPNIHIRRGLQWRSTAWTLTFAVTWCVRSTSGRQQFHQISHIMTPVTSCLIKKLPICRAWPNLKGGIVGSSPVNLNKHHCIYVITDNKELEMCKRYFSFMAYLAFMKKW